MNFLGFIHSKKKEISIEEMKEMTERWFSDYISNYRVSGKIVMHHELYMFCGWIIWDYMQCNEYLPSNAYDDYLPFIHEKVDKFEMLTEKDFRLFYSRRIKMYKKELRRLMSSNKPYLMESLYGALYKSFSLEEDPYYDCIFYNEMREICEFMDKIRRFWNKVNKELIRNYKRKK